jgi:hypothetical protein
MLSVGGGADTQKAIKGQLSDVDFHTMLYLYGRRGEPGSNLFQGLVAVHAANWLLKRSPCPIY